jgi:hypothetical protein
MYGLVPFPGEFIPGGGVPLGVNVSSAQTRERDVYPIFVKLSIRETGEKI